MLGEVDKHHRWTELSIENRVNAEFVVYLFTCNLALSVGRLPDWEKALSSIPAPRQKPF